MSEEQQSADSPVDSDVGAGGEAMVDSDPVGPDGAGPILDPWMLRYAVYAYLVMLPIGHLLVVPINGANATLSDVFLAIVILLGAVAFARAVPHYRARGGPTAPHLPAHKAFHVAAVLFLAFGIWVALGGTWGFHSEYALTKGAAYAALGLGTLAILWCGAEWGKAADAWLLGTAVCLVGAWALAFVGPEAVQERVVYRGGSIRGLPLPRLSGPFLHPNMFGDYLVVSGALLWARWRPLRARLGIWATVGAAALAVTLFLTVSSAWIGAGVLLAVIGLLMMRQRQGRVSIHRKRPGPVIFLMAGVALFAVSFLGIMLEMTLEVGGLSIEASGIRPSIWASAWEAVLESPLVGVGASPYLAQAADPLGGSSYLELWDAHSLYLSLLGQFGIVGFLLLLGAVVVLARAMVREGITRRHAALLVALVAVAIHGLTVASEDFRHIWALLGLVGLASLPEWAQGRWWKDRRTEQDVEAAEALGGERGRRASDASSGEPEAETA